MNDVFLKHSTKLVDILKSYKNNNKIINIQELLQSFTFDTICDIAFSVEESEALNSFEKNKQYEFLYAFDRAQQICMQRGLEPAFLQRFKRKYKIGDEKDIEKFANIVNKKINNIIDKRLDLKKEIVDDNYINISSDNHHLNNNDVLDHYIFYAKKYDDKSLIDKKFLRDVVLNFMIAGRDTTR